MSKAQLFLGKVMHRRLRPTENRFVYAVYFCRLPLHALASVSNKVFSHNRFNLLSFHDADHGPRDGSALLPWVRGVLARAGVAADGEVWLQCFPRVLGYVFNPVSFWYCHDSAGQLKAVLAEVSNTFGEHHNYLLFNPDGASIGENQVLEASKAFHVSPFCAVEGGYRFRFFQRDGHLLARIDYADADGDLLHTAISGTARVWSSRALLSAFFRYPLMSFGVILRIHWQALRLWIKRVPLFRQPTSSLKETPQ